ncbi:MAG: M28 family peptidase [Chitinophagales bacterium]|nr:M28 family peptidase [Chitinophagales bacterium]
MHLLKPIALLLSTLMIIAGCGGKKTGNVTTPVTKSTETAAAGAVVPDFSADSAYAFVARQVAFGPRIPGTAAQQKCAQWLEAKLKSYSSAVVLQDVKVTIYNGSQVPCKNIIASFHPEIKKRILLCAHWDTRPWSDQDSLHKKSPFDGADDGGSGVAVLLEIARLLHTQSVATGIDIALFDVEDYGPPYWEEKEGNEQPSQYCIGTQHWAKNPHVKDYRAYYGILLDMVGAKGATFPMEGLSMRYAPSVVKNVWDVANGLGYGNYFVYAKTNAITDDHAFVNSINGTPCIDIINMTDKGFAKHWHTQQDNLSVIDKATLKAVGQTLLQIIFNEAPGV